MSENARIELLSQRIDVLSRRDDMLSERIDILSRRATELQEQLQAQQASHLAEIEQLKTAIHTTQYLILSGNAKNHEDPVLKGLSDKGFAICKRWEAGDYSL